MPAYRRQAQRDRRIADARKARKLFAAGATLVEVLAAVRSSRTRLYKALDELARLETDELLS